jgi:nicotinamidase-related amidase
VSGRLIGLDEGQKPALVVVECQNRMTNPKYRDENRAGLMEQVVSRGIIDRINRLSAAFRSHDLPVVFATIALRPGFRGYTVNCLLAAQLIKNGSLIIGSDAARLNDDLVVEPTDIVSNRVSGMAVFTGTEVDAILRGFDVDTVVLAGVSTNIALPSSACEAVGLGYNVVLAEDCTAGGTAETHHMQVTMHLPFLATVASSDDIIGNVGAQAPMGV